MEIIIREFTAADEEGVQLVSKESLATLRKFYAPGLASKQIDSQSSSSRLIATSENRIIGTVTIEEDGDSLYFGSLGVLEEFRRRGVLRAMVNHLEQFAKNRGFRKLTCATVNETGNVQIFKKLGFQVISSQLTSKFIDPDGQPVTEVRLEKLVS